MRGHVRFTLSTLRLRRVGEKWTQIMAGCWVHGFLFGREGMSCFSEVWRFLYLCHGPQKLPSVVRQELWLVLLFIPLPCTDLRVPVDPMVMVSLPVCCTSTHLLRR